MKIQKEVRDDHQVKVTAEFEPELLEQFKHKAARKIAQRTRIPGFRPGKAPYNMVVTHVGESSVVEEAIELMLDKVYPDVIQESEVTPFGPGKLDAITSENPPVFEFIIPLEPKVDLGELEKIHEDYAPLEIADSHVEDFILRARRNAGTIVPIETPAEEGNVVFITIEAENSDPGVDEEPTLLKSSPQQVMIPTKGEEHDSEWPFRGFSRTFIGHSAGEDLEVKHQYSEDHSEDSFKGKNVLFKIHIQSVKALELPELNDEFITTMGEFKSVVEFQDAVREKLQTDSDAEYKDSYYTKLVDKIRQDATIKYPPQMLAEEEEQVLHRFEHELSHRKLDLDLYLKLRKKDRETFIREEVTPSAINRLERSLIMEALSKKFDIKVSNEELEKEISSIINELLTSGELQDVKKELGDKKFANAISMEAANRSLEKAIRKQLLLIASPESVKESVDENSGDQDNNNPTEELENLEQP